MCERYLKVEGLIHRLLRSDLLYMTHDLEVWMTCYGSDLVKQAVRAVNAVRGQ